MKLARNFAVIFLALAGIFACTLTKKRAGVNDSYYGRSDRGVHGYPANNSEDQVRHAFGG